MELVHERVRWQLGRLTDAFVNSGMSGWSSAEVLAEADWLVNRHHPDVLSISLGTNDAHTSKRMSPAHTQAAIVALAEGSGASRLVVHTPVLPASAAQGPGATRPRFVEHVDAVRAAADRVGAVLVDHWAHWERRWGTEEPLAWLHDPIHPNARGHLEMADWTLRTLGLGALAPEVWPSGAE